MSQPYTKISPAAQEVLRIVKDAKQGKSRTIPEQAIHRRCVHCAYDPDDDGSRNEQIAGCGVTGCGLYEHRIAATGRAVPPTPAKADSKNIQHKDRLIAKHMMAGTAADAIKAYCIDCIYDATDSGSWREQVRNCRNRTCDLYIVRPK